MSVALAIARRPNIRIQQTDIGVTVLAGQGPRRLARCRTWTLDIRKLGMCYETNGAVSVIGPKDKLSSADV